MSQKNMKPYILSSTKSAWRVFKAWSFFPFGTDEFKLHRPPRGFTLAKRIKLEKKRARHLLKEDLKRELRE